MLKTAQDVFAFFSVFAGCILISIEGGGGVTKHFWKVEFKVLTLDSKSALSAHPPPSLKCLYYSRKLFFSAAMLRAVSSISHI